MKSEGMDKSTWNGMNDGYKDEMKTRYIEWGKCN